MPFCRTTLPSSLALVAVASLAGCPGGSVSYEPAFLSVSTEVVDFGEVEIETTNRLTITLVNRGDSPGFLIDDPVIDTLGGIFQVVVGSDRIEPQRDLGITVVFAPITAGTYETTVTFKNDSINKPEITVTLKGKAIRIGDCKRNEDCEQPLTPICLNSTTSRLYLPFGQCVDNKCVHESEEEACNPSWGCNFDTGRCKTDPCIGVSCQDPPSRCFLGNGQCVNGACVYPVNNGAVCSDENGCTDNDRCLEGSCIGTPKVCELNEAATLGFCEQRGDGGWQVKNQRDPTGTCMEVSETSGRCEYNEYTLNCPVGCEAGKCKVNNCANRIVDGVDICDDRNPCTIDGCSNGECTHTNDNGATCDLNADCSVGQCNQGRCRPVVGGPCTAEIELDLCTDVEVPGTCDSVGKCTPSQTPGDEFTCPGCVGLCVQCSFLQLCIPFN